MNEDIKFTMPVPVEQEQSLTNRMATKILAGVLAASMFIAACSDKDSSSDAAVDYKFGDTPTTAEATTSTVGETSTSQTTTTREASTTTATTEAEVSESNEIAGLLTVTDESLFDCIVDGGETDTIELAELNDGNEIVEPKVNSTLKVDRDERTQDNRLWSDAIANPVTSELDDEEAVFDEIRATICEDPLVASMVANTFANMEVEGHKIIELNPWLEGYEGDASVVNDNAKELVPQFGDTYLDAEELEEALDANAAHRELAEKLGTLLARFENLGVQSASISDSYHLVAGGLVVGELPEVEMGISYEGRVLMLNLTTKDGRCIEMFAFNVDDQRVAITITCDGTPVTTTTQSRPTTTTQPRPTTTTQPTTTTTSPTTTTKTTQPKTAPTYPDGEIQQDNKVGPVTPPQPTTSIQAPTTTEVTSPAVTTVETTEPGGARQDINQGDND